MTFSTSTRIRTGAALGVVAGLCLAPTVAMAQDDMETVGGVNYYSSGTTVDGLTASGPFLGCDKEPTLAAWELRNGGDAAVGVRFGQSNTHWVPAGGRIVGYTFLTNTDADGRPAVFYPLEINGYPSGLVATSDAPCHDWSGEEALVEHDFPDAPAANFYESNPPQCCGAEPDHDDEQRGGNEGPADDGAEQDEQRGGNEAPAAGESGQDDAAAVSGPRIETGTVATVERTAPAGPGTASWVALVVGVVGALTIGLARRVPGRR